MSSAARRCPEVAQTAAGERRCVRERDHRDLHFSGGISWLGAWPGGVARQTPGATGGREAASNAPLAPLSAAQGQYEDTWESSDGLSYAEGKVIPPGDPWPALVSVDAIDLYSLAEHDARSLATWLSSLADVAHHWNRSAFARRIRHHERSTR